MNKATQIKLENLLNQVAYLWDLEICSLKLKTNQNPITIEIFIKKTNGGDISLVGIEKDTVKVMFEGACSTCTVNQMTLKSGVEMIIKKHVPEIQKVVSVEEI